MTESHELSHGRELALQVAEQLRMAHPTQNAVEFDPIVDPRTSDEQQVYVHNPGHNPIVEN